MNSREDCSLMEKYCGHVRFVDNRLLDRNRENTVVLIMMKDEPQFLEESGTLFQTTYMEIMY